MIGIGMVGGAGGLAWDGVGRRVPGRLRAADAASRAAAAAGAIPRLAVIGCGAVVEQLYRGSLRRLEARRLARVVALVDPNLARASALAGEFRDARPFPSATAALADRSVDLAIVTSPPGWHAEHAVTALEHGSHVLCEKPLAARVDEGEAMVAAARRAGRTLAVGMTRRFVPSFAETRRLVTAGELGDDLRFVYREGDVFGWPSQTDAAFRRETGGGGVLRDLGAHVLDSVVWLFGGAEVWSCEDDALTGGVEANCRMRLACPAARGLVQLSWSQPLVTGLHVIGSAGELKLDPGSLDRLLCRRGDAPWETVVARHTWPADLEQPARRRGTPRSYYDAFYYQLVQVLRAIVHGEPVPVDGAEALAVLRLIDEGYGQARPLALPWLPAGEQAVATARHWRHAG